MTKKKEPIRRLIDALVTIESQSFAHPYTKKLLLAEFQNNHARLIGISPEGAPFDLKREGANSPLDGDLCGYLLLHHYGDDTIEIHRIAVLPEQRKSGIGTRLLDGVLKFAQECNAGAILLEVSVKNETAIRFYLNRGFTQIAKRKRYYPDGSDGLILRLLLHSETDTGEKT